MKDKLIELIVAGINYNETVCEAHYGCGGCPNKGVRECAAANIADHLIANGVTVQRWIPANEPPKKYRDEYGELIPFLVCEYGTEKPFRAVYDGREWGDGCFAIMVTHWMPLPEPPKGERE